MLPEDMSPECGKSPTTRLLDLLAGWSIYAQQDEDAGINDAPGVTDAICDLYQEAGNLPNGDDQAVRRFVAERIIPLLYR